MECGYNYKIYDHNNLMERYTKFACKFSWLWSISLSMWTSNALKQLAKPFIVVQKPPIFTFGYVQVGYLSFELSHSKKQF
jgi:hypothetical protein